MHWLGKIKTIAQMVAIPMLLYDDWFVFFDSHYLGTRLIWIAALLTVWSMGYYMRKAYPRRSSRARVMPEASTGASRTARRPTSSRPRQ